MHAKGVVATYVDLGEGLEGEGGGDGAVHALQLDSAYARFMHTCVCTCAQSSLTADRLEWTGRLHTVHAPWYSICEARYARLVRDGGVGAVDDVRHGDVHLAQQLLLS